jgi:hypothetical protein
VTDPTDNDEHEDGPWVVVVGTLWDGFEIVGPFRSWDAASEWADPMMDIAGFCVLKEPSEEDT